MFIGPKMSTVFASRWKALAWSAGVLLTAYCSIPSPDQGDGNEAASANLAIGSVFGGGAEQPASPLSPWAPDPPKPLR